MECRPFGIDCLKCLSLFSVNFVHRIESRHIAPRGVGALGMKVSPKRGGGYY